jgi:hypothetical protein
MCQNSVIVIEISTTYGKASLLPINNSSPKWKGNEAITNLLATTTTTTTKQDKV